LLIHLKSEFVMNQSTDSTRIPTILVTGFLGSGKTTFLKRLAENHPEWRLVFLVNEFAETSVDGETLAAAGTPTQSVVGGSLFCECKAGDFIRTMRETVLGAHREQPLDAVIIETSGIADPEAIGTLFNDHDLDAAFLIHRIVTVVAPKNILKLIDNMPVAAAQVRTSDTLIINKADTVPLGSLREVEAKLRALNPSAEILQASYCEVPFDLTARPHELPDEELATCDANPFSCRVVKPQPGRAVEDWQAWLDGLPVEVVRVKGNVPTDSGWMRVEKTVDDSSIVAVTETATATREPGLTFIVPDEHEELLDSLEEGLARSASVSASKSK